MARNDPEARLRTVTHWDAEAVRELVALPRLKRWNFAPKATFEPDVLGELMNLPELQSLGFRRSELESRNLRALASLASLQRLDLKVCRFELADFVWLCEQLAEGACPRLTNLCLEATSIGDEELQALGKVERLHWITLSETNVSDVGLEHLRGVKKLEILWLQNTRVSEAGVLGLAVLPKLSVVAMTDAKASEKVCEELLRARIALQKSDAPLDAAQLQAAEGQLRGFLAEMERWELDAWTRQNELIHSSKTIENFSHVVRALAAEVGAQRAAIFARYCSRKLQKPVVVHNNLSGVVSNLPQFRASVDWIDAETPTKTKTYFYADAFVRLVIKRRYTLVLEDGAWKLNEVQWWDRGWKREKLR